MTNLEKVALENWARQLSDSQLRKEYNNAFNILLDAYEDNHNFGIPYSKEIEIRVNILGKICTERGISLW